VAERRAGELPGGRERLAEAARRQVEVALRVDEREERGGHPEQADGEAREPVEHLLGLGVEEPRAAHGGHARGVADCRARHARGGRAAGSLCR
jgi:hypothetical protein